MPKQKDLKRLVRSRMTKTGESYTAARLQLVRKSEPKIEYATLGGLSDEAVQKATGRNWRQWVELLDAAEAAALPHRDIARHVASLGTPSWWTQTVTVGYERIRGLRQQRQRRDGLYEASKSRTFHVSIEKLFRAFSDARRRKRWLDQAVTIKSATAGKRMRLGWPDGTQVQVGFTSKGEAKSAVAIQHEKLPDRAAVEATKKQWSDLFDRLSELFS